MPSQNNSQAQFPLQTGANGTNVGGVPRNVSFAKDSNESTAYREHNPPTVLRMQEAARREHSPVPEARPSTEDAPAGYERAKPRQRPPTFQLGRGTNSRDVSPSSTRVTIAPHVASRQGSTGSAILGNENLHRTYSNQDASALKQTSAAATPSPSFGANNKAAATVGVAPKSHHILHSNISPSTSQQMPPSATASHTSLASTMSHLALSEHNASHAEKLADADKQNEVHILVAVTGSVATIKLPQIIHKLKQIYRKRAIIQVVVTKASTTFFDANDLPRDVKVWYDSDEWRSRQAPVTPTEVGSHSDQQLHIRLRRWADILLVAPCSANTLAKFTYGICDNLLTSIFRVWNPMVPILLAPAMNTHMYTNPVTKVHFNILKEFYPFVEILKPVEKVLVCGDIGMGGMREWTDIVQILVKRVGVALDDDEDDEDDSEDDSAPK